jgi:hypothetical protein
VTRTQYPAVHVHGPLALELAKKPLHHGDGFGMAQGHPEGFFYQEEPRYAGAPAGRLPIKGGVC